MFGTSGLRGTVGEAFTAERALDVGRAVASEGAGRVVVGRDARLTGPLFADGMTAGLRECGADVVVLGRASTPTIARGISWYDADAGVSITASHNPPSDNGVKLWARSGQSYTAAAYDDVASRVREEAFTFADWDATGTLERVGDADRRHVDALCETVSGSLDLEVVVDVGNGTGQVTTRALDRLGCRVQTLNGQADGRFPGRPSEPTADNCASLCEVVAATDADLGIAHDGDADRMLAVTERGEFVPGDDLLAVFALDAVGPVDRVAAPVNTSLAVDDALAAVGASLTRTRVGDVHVAERLAEDGVVFGGEPSGAWMWRDGVRCPDGPLAAVRLANLVDREGPLSEQLATLPDYPIRRGSVPAENGDEVVRGVRRRATAAYDEVSTLDGVRVTDGDGWFLVRASGTQPLVRLTAEARSEARTDALFEEASRLVEASTGAV